MKLYLEDLTLGQRFTSRAETIDAAAIIAFATQYDPQPFHLDDTLAQASLFRGLAASGWHTGAISMRLIVESVPLAGGVIGASFDELRWPRPVRPGDTLHVTSEVIEIRTSKSNPAQGWIKLRGTTLNQDGAIVMVVQPNLVVPCRPQPHGETG